MRRSFNWEEIEGKKGIRDGSIFFKQRKRILTILYYISNSMLNWIENLDESVECFRSDRKPCSCWKERKIER